MIEFEFWQMSRVIGCVIVRCISSGPITFSGSIETLVIIVTHRMSPAGLRAATSIVVLFIELHSNVCVVLKRRCEDLKVSINVGSNLLSNTGTIDHCHCGVPQRLIVDLKKKIKDQTLQCVCECVCGRQIE